jgi:hypothetical protein
MRAGAAAVAVLALVGMSACRTGRDYPDAGTPRYGGAPVSAARTGRGDTLRIVSFNIEYATETRRAVRILRSAPALRDADIILLQEMTAPATEFLADSLHMHYVYYPASTTGSCDTTSGTPCCPGGP